MAGARLVRDCRNIVGESLIWVAEEGALYWVDIGGRSISMLRPADGGFESWATPDFPTSIGLRKDGGFIVGLTRDICFWRPGEEFQIVARPEPELTGNRLNEGVVAPDGSFWVGSMDNNLNPDGSPKKQTSASGGYYRLAPDLSLRQLTPNEYGITNTMGWLAGQRFVTADTLANTLYQFDVEPDGCIGNRRVFAAGFERGFPDGSCVDGEGYLWNCRVAGGSCVVRFSPSGSVDRVVELPCSWPTSCAFGGPELATLYVTSARFTMSAEHLAANPQEGGLFAVDVAVRGVLPNRFG
nr:SMP-30/gluconolactonase/LRE family protein [Mesorhizobium shangrilense]